MKKYESLSNKYVKKNSFINNTLGYYKKPIFITFLSAMIIAICSLLVVQVTNIEKNERLKTVVFIIDLKANSPTALEKEYEEQYPHLDFIVLNARVYQHDDAAISELNRYNAEQLGIVDGYMIYRVLIVLYDEFGRHVKSYYRRSNVTAVLEEKGWI